MSRLAEQLDGYLALRRALGYRLEDHARFLGSFVAFVDARGESTLTVATALAWASRASTDRQAARRLSTVRCFARHLAAFDPATEVPPTALGPGGQRRCRPYLYSPAQVGALMDAAAALRPQLWAASFSTLIGLMSATGIRSGEAYALARSDVDLDDAQLSVMHSKSGRARRLPLHPSTVEALASYLQVRDAAVMPEQAGLFVTASGRALNATAAAAGFRRLLADCAIAAPPGRRAPRLYDFRHSFAVATILGWHRAGADVWRRLPVLSAYLGHVGPSETYWYLEASPELMATVAGRLAHSWEEPR